VAATVLVALVLVAGVSGFAWNVAKRGASARAEQVVSSALLELNAGRYREGLEKVQEALDRAPDLCPGRVVLARLLMKLGRTSEALKDAGRFWRTIPTAGRPTSSWPGSARRTSAAT
jgi:Tfp pilus assembly protein PilF